MMAVLPISFFYYVYKYIKAESYLKDEEWGSKRQTEGEGEKDRREGRREIGGEEME